MSSPKKKDTYTAGKGKEVAVSELLAKRSAELALEKKCVDFIILDLRGVSSVTDLFVIATADSARKSKAAAEHVIDELKEDGSVQCISKEWIPCTGFCWIMLMLLCISLCLTNAVFMTWNHSGPTHR